MHDIDIPTCCVSIFEESKVKPVSGEIRSTALPLCCLVPDTLIHMQNSVDNIGTECLAEKLAKF